MRKLEQKVNLLHSIYLSRNLLLLEEAALIILDLQYVSTAYCPGKWKYLLELYCVMFVHYSNRFSETKPNTVLTILWFRLGVVCELRVIRESSGLVDL